MIDLHIGCDSNDAYSSCTGGKVLDAGGHGCRTSSSCWIPHGSQVVVFTLLLLLFHPRCSLPPCLLFFLFLLDLFLLTLLLFIFDCPPPALHPPPLFSPLFLTPLLRVFPHLPFHLSSSLSLIVLILLVFLFILSHQFSHYCLLEDL